MKRLILKLIIVITFLLTCSIIAKAQSLVMEITWNVYITYKGLMVTYPDNTGIFAVNYWHPEMQTNITVVQDVSIRNQYDMYGNCTTFLNCYNPKAYPYTPYSADNFIIYPNGAMYTQDYAGNWSTAIMAQVINPNLWRSKFREYGLE